MNSSAHQSIPEPNVRLSVRLLKLSWNLITQCNTISRTATNFQQGTRKRKRCNDPVKFLWNVGPELCINKWPQNSMNWSKVVIFPRRSWWCERLIKAYRKPLIQVIAAKIGSISYWIVFFSYSHDSINNSKHFLQCKVNPFGSNAQVCFQWWKGGEI